MHKQYKGLRLTADVQVLRILQLAEARFADKPGFYQRLYAEFQDASPNATWMICEIQSAEWSYHALRGEQHILDFRLGKALDKWATELDLTKPYRIVMVAGDGQVIDPPDTDAPPDQPEIDTAMTASRDELIAAFGPHTGMNLSWFNDLNHVPGLKSALALPGRRGKHSVQPRFFVFPVMQWLVYGRRRAGAPIQDDTAWRILKNKFPKIYEAYQSHDPRNSG